MTDTAPETPAVADATVETPPAPDTTQAVEVSAPEAPAAPEAPTFDWEDEAVRTRAAEALSHLEKWGAPEEVERALAIDKALRTEEGVTSLFVQAGKALGLSPDQLDALFAPADAGTQAPAEEEVDPDRVLTWKEAQELFQKQLTAAQQTAQEAAERTAQETAAASAVQETLKSLGVTDPVEVDAVLRAGDKFLPDGSLDPEQVKAAVRRGFAEYERVVKERQKAYLKSKIENAETLPSSIGAPSPGGVDLPEPQNVEEAKARARARMRGEQ